MGDLEENVLSYARGNGQIQVVAESRSKSDIRAQKSRTLLVRVREGPTKNLLSRRQRNVQQARHIDTMVPAGISNLIAKDLKKLGRFSRTFAEITDVMSLKAASACRRASFQLVI